jgi:multiple sugar transport system permease protein
MEGTHAPGGNRTAPKQPGLGLKKRLKLILGPDWSEAYLFILPAVILLAGVVALPFLSAFLLSFTNTHRFEELGAFVGLRNYISLWQDYFFRTSVWITLQYTFWTVLIKLVVGLIAALLLHRLKRFTALMIGLVLLPWIVPEVVRATTWKGLLDPLYGGVNRLLLDLGLIERAIPFFGDVQTALPSVITVNVWAGIPFFTIILLAGLKAIDQELYEAAAIDGASAWRQFLHISLPGLRYVIIVGVLLSTILAFNEFTPIAVLTRGGPMGATLVYSIRVYEAGLNLRFGMGVAMGMSLVPILGLLIMLLSRYMLAGYQSGGNISTQGRGPVGNLFHQLGRPLRGGVRFIGTVLWLVHDAAESLIERAGVMMGNQSKMFRQRGKWLAGLGLLLLLVFELGPFYWVIITSFKTTLQLTTLTNVLWPKPWTLEQYELLLGPSRRFWIWFGHSLLISLITPLIATYMGAFGAYGLTRLRWRGRGTFSSLVLIAYMMPGVLLLIPLKLIFAAFDLENSLWSLILAYPSFALPFALWMMMSYYNSIPEELEAAGLIDGCTRFQVFWQIILPLTKPALMSIFLFGMTQSWGEYLFASAFLSSEKAITLPVALASMVLSEVAPWGEVTAASILMAIPVFILYAAGQKFMVAGLAAGAVKGGG